MKITQVFNQARKRLFMHPQLWIIRYVLSFIPALFFAIIIILLIWRGIANPLIINALNQRKIDFLLDVLMQIGDSRRNLLLPLFMALLACLAWLPVQLTSIWLEGGTLASYTSKIPITWKAFRSACNRWFGFILLVRCVNTMFTTIFLISAILISFLVQKLWVPLTWLTISCGLLLIFIFNIWSEIIRSVAVTHGERQIGHALRISIKLILQDPYVIYGFAFVTIVSIAALLAFRQWMTTVIPITWWLLNFILFQGLSIARYGLRLFRWSGEIVIVQHFNQAVSSS